MVLLSSDIGNKCLSANDALGIFPYLCISYSNRMIQKINNKHNTYANCMMYWKTVSFIRREQGKEVRILRVGDGYKIGRQSRSQWEDEF